MTDGMLLAILSRPGGTGFESLDTFDDEKLFDSIASEFDDTPDQNAVGVVEQGWEWINIKGFRQMVYTPRIGWCLVKSTTADEILIWLALSSKY